MSYRISILGLLVALTLGACSSGGESQETDASATGNSEASPELVAFRECIIESEAVFYGTEWCPHCTTQRELLGGFEHTDCDRFQSTCRDKAIAAYPTWIFADGSRAEGVQSLEALSEATGCVLPDNLKTEEEASSVDLEAETGEASEDGEEQ